MSYLKQKCCKVYFPYVFGVFNEMLGIGLVTCEDKKSGNSFKHGEEKKLTSADWNVFFFFVSVKHNDLISNNVLLKSRNNVWVPKFAVKRKVTFKSNPETYILSNAERGCYNKIYPHLAYKLRNIYGSKT